MSTTTKAKPQPEPQLDPQLELEPSILEEVSKEIFGFRKLAKSRDAPKEMREAYASFARVQHQISKDGRSATEKVVEWATIGGATVGGGYAAYNIGRGILQYFRS